MSSLNTFNIILSIKMLEWFLLLILVEVKNSLFLQFSDRVYTIDNIGDNLLISESNFDFYQFHGHIFSNRFFCKTVYSIDYIQLKNIIKFEEIN